MSKIAETKALEAYPYLNEERRKIYIKGYDQAMQDFLEKACEYLRRNYPYVFSAYNIEQFKNYMQDEN